MKTNLYFSIILLSLFFLVNKNAIAQSPDWLWAKAMGGDGDDRSTSIAIDVSGNVCTTGSFSGTVDFDPGAGVFNLTSVGLTDIFISKLDGSGKFVWAKAMGGIDVDEGSSIAIDASGNIYTTGYFVATVDFDPGMGIFYIASAGNSDIFVSKLDSSGNFVIVWDNSFQQIRVRTGSIVGAAPALSLTSCPDPVQYGHSPDVSIVGAFTNYRVLITYINNSGNLRVGHQSWGNLDNNPSGPCPLGTLLNENPGAGFFFQYPRIACPVGPIAFPTYEVVVERFKPTGIPEYGIRGYNIAGPITTMLIYDYTDLTGIPYGFADVLSVVPNHGPAVTYDDHGNIWVGWTMDNDPAGVTGAIEAQYPIGLICAADGAPQVAGTYWNVPVGVLPGQSKESLSLAGRYATDKLFLTFSDVPNDQVWHKVVENPDGLGHFRFAQSVTNGISVPDDELLTLQLFDLSGRLVYSAKIFNSEINQSVAGITAGMPDGLYLLRAVAGNGTAAHIRKVFIGGN